MNNISIKHRILFWSHVNIGLENDCWEYKYPYLVYARFTIQAKKKRRTHLAHRLAYYLATGIEPRDLFVCHSCDNPRCCNPKHLWLGTHKDNMDDCRNKDRNNPAPAAKLTEEEVKIVKELILESRYTNKYIGAIFGVTHSNISAIKRNKSWKNV